MKKEEKKEGKKFIKSSKKPIHPHQTYAQTAPCRMVLGRHGRTARPLKPIARHAPHYHHRAVPTAIITTTPLRCCCCFRRCCSVAQEEDAKNAAQNLLAESQQQLDAVAGKSR